MSKITAKELRAPLAEALRAILAMPTAPAKRRQGVGMTGRALSQTRLNRLSSLSLKARDLLGKTADPARQERLRATLSAIEEAKGRLRKVEPVQGLSECPAHIHSLEERKFKLTRRLTLQEQRINFVALNERFNALQAELEEEMEEATADEIARATSNIKNKLDAGDIAGIAALTFLFRGRIREALNKSVKSSYDIGKIAASKEIGVLRGATPLRDTQVMNLDVADIAEAYAASLEGAAKGAVKDGISVGANTAAIVASVRSRVNETASRGIMNVSGTVVGQYVNRGRGTVLFDNITKIIAFQRSEVLDDATCDMCLSLDERVVAPDDPIARMEIVHSHCRGLWVPVLAADEEIPDVTGVPKSIMDNFDTVDGTPVVNAYTQLKKPVNSVSKAAQAEIKKRLEEADE